jgi:hypothetical protein
MHPIIIDYQYTLARQRDREDYEELAKVCKSITKLAAELEVCIITANQKRNIPEMPPCINLESSNSDTVKFRMIALKRRQPAVEQ